MNDVAQPMTRNGGSRPVPDPTVLTDQAISKSEKAQRDWTEGQFAVRDERLRGIDEATKLRLSVLDQVAGTMSETISQKVSGVERVLDQKIAGLSDLVDERFAAVERQRIEQKADTKAAVDAALSAAKEAVKEQTTASQLATSKSDAATASQLQQQAATFSTEIAGLRRSLEEVKERENDDVRNLRTEISAVATTANATIQQKQGAVENRSGLYAAIGIMAVIVGSMVGIAGLALALTSGGS